MNEFETFLSMSASGGLLILVSYWRTTFERQISRSMAVLYLDCCCFAAAAPFGSRSKLMESVISR